MFSRLAASDRIRLLVIYGEDFAGTKVVNMADSPDFETAKLPSLKLSFKTANGSAYIPMHRGLWKELSRFRPNIIITEGASNALNNLVCFVFAKLNGCAIVQWGLGEIKDRRRSFARLCLDLLFFRYIERHSDAAIAYSSRGAEYYKRIGLSVEKIFTAVNTVDTNKRMSKAKALAVQQGRGWPVAPPSSFRIIFVGALAENKGVDLLLRAFAKFSFELKEVYLTIVGDGPLRAELEGQARELGISGLVEFAGHQSEEIGKYFLDSTVMVMPGLGGLAVSDSLAHGVPVICGVGDGSEADLIDGSNGRILDPMTEETLVAELKGLKENRKIQEKWRENSIKRIKEEFNIEAYVSEMMKCIEYVYKD